MARIYTNENFYRSVAGILRELGHDVLTTRDAGKDNRGIPDEEVFSFAQAEKRIIVTFNRRHFIRLHRHHSIHSGIIVCTQDKDFKALANRIHETIQSLRENIENQLVRVNRPNPSKK